MRTVRGVGGFEDSGEFSRDCATGFTAPGNHSWKRAVKERMPPSTFDEDQNEAILARRRAWKRWIIALVAGLSVGAVGYAIAYALGCSTGCATGRSPMTFALLLGFVATVAAASGARRANSNGAVR